MTMSSVSNSLLSQRKRLHGLVVRGAEFLCMRASSGSWGDARTSSSAIWALCECGLFHSQPEFIQYHLEQLLASEECQTDEEGISFSFEVWDSSLGLIALRRGGATRFSSQIESIADWILSEYSDGAFKHDPWETLWALYALISSGKPLREISSIVKSSMSWVLMRRNPEGILIWSHYMGFLLAVLSQIVSRIRLKESEKHEYDQAIVKCLTYLKQEYMKGRRKGDLWGSEPWIIGHVLQGIACCDKSDEIFFQDARFNDYLIEWYEENWDEFNGWIDVLDSANTLIGLSKYYVGLEAYYRGSDEIGKADILREITSEVRFRFDASKISPRMTVQPIWRSRVKTNDKSCFLLMPFGQPWSPGIRELLRNIMTPLGFSLVRADDMYGPIITEDVWKGINEARIVIAECSPPLNANVFYELGIAHTLGKDVIIVTQAKDIQEVPFDIRHLRHIRYTNDDRGYRELREELPKHVSSILRGV